MPDVLDKNQTLVEVLGDPIHASPLLDSIRAIIRNQVVGNCLKQLGVHRGCLHYDGALKSPTAFPRGINVLSNEEAAISLCHGSLHYDPMNIRVAANILSSNTCRPGLIIRLAAQEHCQTVVGYIARCGKRVEPQNSLWDQIRTALAPIPGPPEGALPHWTRFVSMTAFPPKGRPGTIWLRPSPKYERTLGSS